MDTETRYTFAMLDGVSLGHEHCFLAQFSSEPCAGRMERAHLLRQQTLRRHLTSIMREEVNACLMSDEDVRLFVWDERTWRPACHRHHTAFDQSKTLRIPRSAIPADTEQYAREWGFGWFLDRTYGERQEKAA
jgi:hypothetical protein